MKEYSIIHNERNQLTLVEEPVIGNPIFTSCSCWTELFEQLAMRTGDSLNYYKSIDQWTIAYKDRKREMEMNA